MKTSKILLQASNSNNEEIPKKVIAGKVIVIFMLLWMTLLTSCMVFVPVREHDGHEHHDNGEHRGQ